MKGLLILLLGVITIIDLQANRLKYEDSPYLQQHAHNPVKWYPWGKEAFEKAKREDKPIFLSIGYSTCHWCHVMERESFENKKIAKILNENFVAIKVDREEHPNIDSYYQNIFTVMNGRSGGWPLTIVMTPDKGVFFSATYLPPDERFGESGLERTLKFLADAYKHRRDDIKKSVESINTALKRYQESRHSQVRLDNSLMKKYIEGVKERFDFSNGGIGVSPKFPHATTILTLLDIYRLNGDKDALKMAQMMLKSMAKGGIYDQIEGGFFRYSTDEAWMIPHFEKMLYTNAELIEAYAVGYFSTKDERFKEVVRESITAIEERFSKEYLLFSASDADSEGEEGKYFLFDYSEALKALKNNGFSTKEAKKICDYLGITKEGNFEGKSNPYINDDLKKPKNIHKARLVLKHLRAKVSYPFIDYKVQTSWNALFIKALFIAAKSIDERYAKSALKHLDTLLNRLYIDNKLYHLVIIGKEVKVEAYLEDYAFLISALIEAYQYRYEKRYLNIAEALTDKAIKSFYKGGKWYMSQGEFAVEADIYDGAYRSALAVMLEDIIYLSSLRDDKNRYHFAKASLERYSGSVNSAPNHYSYMVRVYLESFFKPMVLKAKREHLIKNRAKIYTITYPYLLTKAQDIEAFMACKIDSCFANSKNIDTIINKIQKEF